MLPVVLVQEHQTLTRATGIMLILSSPSYAIRLFDKEILILVPSTSEAIHSTIDLHSVASLSIHGKRFQCLSKPDPKDCLHETRMIHL